MTVIGLVAAATSPSDRGEPSFVVLQRDGTLKRSDGAAIRSVPGTETLGSSTGRDGLIATRAQEIWSIPLDGAEPKLLLRHAAGRARFAEMSADGEFLVFGG